MGASVVVGCFGCLTDLASFDLDERQRLFEDEVEKKGPFEWSCSRCGAEYRRKAIDIRQAIGPDVWDAPNERYHLLLVRQPLAPKKKRS